MTRSVNNLTWVPVSSDSNEFAAVLSIDSTLDTAWTVALNTGSLIQASGTDHAIKPKVMTVDNIANNGVVTVTINPFSWTVPPYTRTNFPIPSGNIVVAFGVTVGAISVTFSESSFAPDLSNQLKIQQTAVTVAQFPYVKYNTNTTMLVSDLNSVVQFNPSVAMTYAMLPIAGTPVQNGAFFLVENRGTAQVSLVPNGANLLNVLYSASKPLILLPGDSGTISCDGSNWFFRGLASYESPEIAFAATPGLASIVTTNYPSTTPLAQIRAQIGMRCKVTDLGFAVGAEIWNGTGYNGSGGAYNFGHQFYMTDAQTIKIYNDNAIGFGIKRYDTGVQANLTLANWRVFIRATCQW